MGGGLQAQRIPRPASMHRAGRGQHRGNRHRRCGRGRDYRVRVSGTRWKARRDAARSAIGNLVGHASGTATGRERDAPQRGRLSGSAGGNGGGRVRRRLWNPLGGALRRDWLHGDLGGSPTAAGELPHLRRANRDLRDSLLRRHKRTDGDLRHDLRPPSLSHPKRHIGWLDDELAHRLGRSEGAATAGGLARQRRRGAPGRHGAGAGTLRSRRHDRPG